MPTYEQLQTESAWRQEVVTPELAWLVGALCDHFRVPRSNGGTKGDNRHLNGGHRSQRWILTSRYCTNRTYTVEAGLPALYQNDIAAFDVTLPPAAMLTISRNADRATRAGQLEELVEWFGNLGGDQRVDGWDNIRNQVASSDSSHLWHFHGRIRRSLLRDMNTMRRIFAALTGTAPTTTARKDDDMSVIAQGPDGQLYHCIGGFSHPITAANIGDIQYVAGQGVYQLARGPGDDVEWSGGGIIRKGWSEAVFGPVWRGPGSPPVGSSAPVDLDELARRVADRLGVLRFEATDPATAP